MGSAGWTTCGTGPALEAFAEGVRMAPRLPGVQCSWAIASILHRAVEYFGRDALLAVRSADVQLPPSEQPWEVQVRPLALEQLKRIVSNYRERNMPSSSVAEALACQSRQRRMNMLTLEKDARGLLDRRRRHRPSASWSMDNSRIDLNRGQRFDAARLQNNHNRWYDASVGRWLSQDPIGFDGADDNLYRYCGNSAPEGLDPAGLVDWTPIELLDAHNTPWENDPEVGEAWSAKTDKGRTITIWKPANGTTYWCHGFTFGGSSAKGGPFSVWGQDVPKILEDDGWKQVSGATAKPKDIVVFYDAKGGVAHTGILAQVAAPGAKLDEAKTTVDSKEGKRDRSTKSLGALVKEYGEYRVYSMSPTAAPNGERGKNELAPQQPSAP